MVEDEASLLREAGHVVHVWAPTPPEPRGRGLLRAGVRGVWSAEAVRHVLHLLTKFQPEVIHCHNLFPMLSPAVLRVAREQVPVVLTLHNYRLLCLPATFLRDGHPCELCSGTVPWQGVRYRCYRGSALASGALASALTLHRAVGSFDRVALFLAVSRFVRDKYAEAGLPTGKLRVKPNFVGGMPQREGPGEYFLYLGRLSAEKGVDTLMDVAWRAAHPLLVVGNGPEETALKRRAGPHVHFKSGVSSTDVPRMLRGARAVVVPSLVYEGAPRVVLEAFSAGVPVIASDLGALAQTVGDGVSGQLVPARETSAWSRAVESLLDDGESERLGEAAQAVWRKWYSPERGLEGLETAYGEALGRLA